MSDPSARVRAFEAAVRVAVDSAERSGLYSKQIKTSDVLEEVQGEKPSKRTVRRALNDAAELGWVMKSHPESHSWKPGDRADRLISRNS